jgi:type II secretory pathway pseudopilin PulG
MTLVEIMIVVIVMALIATGVAFAVTPMVVTGRETQTQSDVRVIQNAVSLYLVQHGVCPGSIDDLTLSRAARRVDAWDNAFAIECDVEQEPMVVSAGQDGQQGTADDIRSADDGSPDSSAGDLGGGIVRAGY